MLNNTRISNSLQNNRLLSSMFPLNLSMVTNLKNLGNIKKGTKRAWLLLHQTCKEQVIVNETM